VPVVQTRFRKAVSCSCRKMCCAFPARKKI